MQTSRWIAVLLLTCFASTVICQDLGSTNASSEKKVSNNFSVYWNVPTELCQAFNISLGKLHRYYCIVQNKGDKINGDKIVHLYRPGDFPYIEANGSKINGGVPQNGNLDQHIKAFERSVVNFIPNENFSGIAVINFQNWPPLFRVLWGEYTIYKNQSIDLDKNEERAKSKFNDAAKNFFLKTLEKAKELRPNAKWGYYNYPHCDNWSSYNHKNECDSTIVKENDGQLSWLFDNESAYMPSVFLNETWITSQNVGMVTGRVQEAVRLANKRKDRENVKVLPYLSYKYFKSNNFLKKDILNPTLQAIMKNGADGVIIWGNTVDFVNNKKHCEDFREFLKNTLGPMVMRLKRVKP